MKVLKKIILSIAYLFGFCLATVIISVIFNAKGTNIEKGMMAIGMAYTLNKV